MRWADRASVSHQTRARTNANIVFVLCLTTSGWPITSRKHVKPSVVIDGSRGGLTMRSGCVIRRELRCDEPYERVMRR